MSISSAIADAAAILSIYVPTSPVSNTSDTSAAKLLAIAHEAGDDIVRRADWPRLLKNTTSSALPLAVPSDFLRLVPGGAINLVSSSPAPARGPLSSDQMAAISRLGVTTALYYAIEGQSIIGSRALTVGESISVYYISKNWLVSLDGTTFSERAIADSDVALFPERLLVKAIVWRYRRETGLQYQDQLAEWEADIALEIRQTRGATV